MCLPVSLPNGQVTYNRLQREDGHYLYNTRASYQCKDGYYLDGPTSSTCTSESVWSSTPTCLEGNNEVALSRVELYYRAQVLYLSSKCILTMDHVPPHIEAQLIIVARDLLPKIHPCLRTLEI